MFELGETLTALEAGGTILYPTDTIWGIGCDATNSTAVSKVRAFKELKPEEGLILLVDSISMLQQYVGEIHPRLQTLLDHHVRPLSIIYDNVFGLAPEIAAVDGSVAIRLTNDSYCQALIGSFGRPIVSTSANRKSDQYPSHFGAISSEVLRAVDHVVKFRQREKSDAQPSMLARWTTQNEIEPIRS